MDRKNLILSPLALVSLAACGGSGGSSNQAAVDLTNLVGNVVNCRKTWLREQDLLKH